MDQTKIGRFIAEKRKAKHLTQSQLADKLGVTDKSVSKWERGICLPNVSLYQELCDELGITLNEFFAGEEITRDDLEQRAEANILSVAQDSTNKQNRLQKIILALVIVSLLLASGTAYAIHVINQKGYFLHNYVRTYSATANENAIKNIITESDANTQLLQFDVDQSYKSITVIMNSYKKGKLVSSEEQMQIPFEEKADRQGIIAITTNLDSKTARITEATSVSKASVERIPLLPDSSFPSQGSYTYSALTDPIDTNKKENLPVAALFIGEEGVEGLPVNDVSTRYSETGTNNDYTFLFLLRFE